MLLSLYYIRICITGMLSMFPGIGNAAEQLQSQIQQQNVIKDPQVVPHVGDILAHSHKIKKIDDINHLSNVVKQSKPAKSTVVTKTAEVPLPLVQVPRAQRHCLVNKFAIQSEKLKWAGLALTKEEVYMIDKSVALVAEVNQAEEVRFWGKILGTVQDYYVIQGRTQKDGGLQDVSRGAEKRGEGVNYYTFWVSNNILSDQWTELPLITPQHVKNARNIKKCFSGDLFRPVVSYPAFAAQQRFYLKAQLVRMTSSLEIVPKGLYKPNDDNPKIVQFEQQPKIPEFGELSSIETWVHRNANVLSLGRCTHYIDPATPEDQIETLTAELAEKDPQIQRLRGITEDKLPEGNPLGIENIWHVRVVGDSQVFQKDEGSSVYGVTVLKNVLWPGWVTIGYKGGFCSCYVGYGHKWTQNNWSTYENGNLGEQAEEAEEFPEPNPKEEPKAVEEVAKEEEPEPEE